MENGATSLVRKFAIKRVRGNEPERVIDTVAAEEPLEIRVGYWFKDAPASQSLAVTMRTPGNDRELAAGFLLTEGIIHNRRDLFDLRALGTSPSNEILAELGRHIDFETWRLARATFVSSGCGICGKRSREAILKEIPERAKIEFTIESAFIERLPALLQEHQTGFAQTGGLHAAALVNGDGRVEAVFEDIGRHNALDKLVGWSVLNDRLPLEGRVIFLSSRSSFELIQKAVMAGASVLATVGGPSSLAIEAAEEYGMTLIGFVREKRFNVYSGDWRVRWRSG